MPRITLADAKASRIPQSIGACATDPRFIQILNEATQILLQEGEWWGTYARFRICAESGCITLPRGIAAIESAAVCGYPITMRSQWFEFLENGWGTQNSSSCESTDSDTNCGARNSTGCGGGGFYRGRFPTFADVQGVDKQLRFVCDLASDVGKIVLALGYDENGNWIRSLQSGTWKDGELITLAQSPGTNSTHLFSAVTDIQFPSTMNGQTWLYEYDTTALTQRLIGAYQYDDTRPSFARYYFPSICNTATNDTCTTTQVEIMAKLDFIPVRNDTDYLLIGNLPALKRMCMAINRSEHEPDGNKSDAIMASGLASAKELLEKELLHYLGSGNVQPIRMPTPALSGGGVENILGNSWAGGYW